MFTLARSIAGLAVACLMLSCSLASAADYRVQFSGTIAGGSDITGVFGPAGSSLAGDPFVATYSYDPANQFPGPGVSEFLYPLSASLKINGATWNFPPHPFDVLGWAQPGEILFNYLFVIDADPADVETINNSATSPLFEPTFAFDHEAVIPVQAGGSFAIDIGGCPTHCGPHFREVHASGSFDTTSVHLIPPGSVPEPTTWTLMILGFGFTGSALRRRSCRAMGPAEGRWVGPACA